MDGAQGMIRRVLRVVGWLLIGLAGTVGIVCAFAIAHALLGPPVMLPSGGVNVKYWDQGAVFASGTWVIEGDKGGVPFQTSKIMCRRGESCTSVSAEIGAGMLNAEHDVMNIARWTPDIVVFTTDTICVSYTYTISRVDQRVIGTRDTKADAPTDSCSIVEKRSLQLSLMDGFVVWTKIETEARYKIYPFFWGALAVMWIFVLVMLIRSVSRKWV